MENTDNCKNKLPLSQDNANGFSLLETVIAISLITLAASVTIQTIYISDTTQINATIAQRDWAEMTNLSAYIHKAFNEDRLVIDNITFKLLTQPYLILFQQKAWRLGPLLAHKHGI